MATAPQTTADVLASYWQRTLALFLGQRVAITMANEAGDVRDVWGELVEARPDGVVLKLEDGCGLVRYSRLRAVELVPSSAPPVRRADAESP